MSSDGRYDVIIIGSGAGGGTLARHLAPSGKRILILERGDWLPREPENWDSKEVFVDNRYVPKETWYDEKDKPFQPGIHYAVGGATKMYGAALYRLRPEDFGELRHHDGISPAWPISYDDMEPYYTKAEHLYEVHGNHGEDSTEGHASAQYPFPALTHEPRIQQLVGRPRAGRLPPVPRAMRRPAAGGRPAQQPVHPLPDVRRFPVPRPGQVRCRDARRPAGAGAPECHASGRGRVVTRLETERRGTAVERVVVERDGAEETYDADIVVVSAGAANSAKILLASANDRHPNGLANGSGQVGRNYMFHNSVAVLAISKEPNPTMFQKTLGAERLLLRDEGLRLPDGQHPDGRQVRRGDVQGREAAPDQARPDVLADRRRDPCGRLLAVDRGPARARQPRHAVDATATSS